MHEEEYRLTIPESQQGRRLDQALAVLLPDYSRSLIKEWILGGRVLLDGRPTAPRTPVSAGQQVDVSARSREEGQARPEKLQLDLVFDDDEILVVNKPAGLVVHPGAGNPSGTLVNGLLHYDGSLSSLPRAGLLHRLDKDTSGLLLVARSLRAHTQLTRDLEARRITREYRALCQGRLTSGGTVDAPVGRHPVHRTRMAVSQRGRPAVTHYRILHRFPQHTFLAVRLESGRTHQIRVHMAHIRHPLVGDAVYGGRLRLPAGATQQGAERLRNFRRQALHASRLEFTHPGSGRQLTLKAPLPVDLASLLEALGDAPAPDFDAMSWPVPTQN